MVSTSQNTNPLGAVVLADGGTPRTFSAKARTVLSGGDLVQVFSGTSALTGSDADTFDTTDVIVQKAENVSLFGGVITQNVGSNDMATVLTKGWILARAGGICSGGALVGHNSSGNFVPWKGMVSGTSTLNDTICGRAMQSIASGTNNFGVISLGL